MADTFIKNPNNLPLVNHKNGDKADNRACNLEWCTHQYNVQHGFDVLGRVGYHGGMNKRVAKIDQKTGEVVREYESIAEASKDVGLKGASINHVVNGRHKTAAGFNWRLVE